MLDINLRSQGFREHVYIKPAYNPAYNKNRQQKNNPLGKSETNSSQPMPFIWANMGVS